MICFAFELPVGYHRGPVVVVMILELENLHRIKASDPFDMKFLDFKLPVKYAAGDVDLVIAYEEERERIIGFQNARDTAGLMEWLERGRNIRPGDLVKPDPIQQEKKQ